MRIWQKIKCKLGWHRLNITMKSPFSSSYKATCQHCGKSFAINDELMCVLPWDIDFEHLAKMNNWEQR